MPSIDTFEMMLRLGMALVAGAILGGNRWLHHKSAGVRTHSLVALGAAIALMLIDTPQGIEVQSLSHVLQGLVTGIGFLGAGVIIRSNHSNHVQGLTTGASIWACALLGAAAGSGRYVLGGLALAAILLTLVLGGPFEQLLGRLFNKEIKTDQKGH